MKKINSIGYGHYIVGFGMVFLIVVPSLVYVISKITTISKFLILLARISLFIGLLIFLFLFILLGIELRQDKRIHKFYVNNRNRRIKISGDFYECQNCGNQKLRDSDRYCPVCGINIKR